MANPLISVLIMFMAFAALSVEPEASISTSAAAAAAPKLSCSNAVSALIPCGSFLLGSGGNLPTKQCCQSAQKLNGAAATKAARQALCACLEQMGPSFGVKPKFAQLLPVYCKLQLKIPISTNANCSQFGSHIFPPIL